MPSLPVNIYSVAAVREFDRIATEEQRVPGYTLMRRAGEVAFALARERFPQAKRWHVLCGPGNNGGDGYVVARLAAGQGVKVTVTSVVDPGSLSGDAATAYEDFIGTGGVVSRWPVTIDGDCDLLVDALLGNGINRPVSGECAAAIDAMNACDSPVHALDIPSGIHGDSGAVMGSAVRADMTTTFVGLKTGLFLGDGPSHSGNVSFSDLGIDASVFDSAEPVLTRIDSSYTNAFLPKRNRGAHKGDFGHVLVVGGGPGMPGAARLCAEAALRAGAGRVTVATHPEHAAVLTIARPELMCAAIEHADELHDLLLRADVVAFGPGLGTGDWAHSLYAHVAASDKPSVWDADALNLLAKAGKIAKNCVITPHPGEAARLLHTTTADVQGDRLAAVRQLQSEYGATCVLKGAGTLVAGDLGQVRICSAGNPGMATAGMGDVLTGVIAALIGQGLDAVDAAAVGVDLHGRAGDLAARHGERGMLASDLLGELRGVVNP